MELRNETGLEASEPISLFFLSLLRSLIKELLDAACLKAFIVKANEKLEWS